MKTNIIKVISLAIELENEISVSYEKASQIAPLQSLRDQLKQLAMDEVSHATLLKTGLNYIANAREAFEGTILRRDEIEVGIKKLKILNDEIENRKIGIHKALENIFNLELFFNKIHLNTIVEIKDESLKNLFKTLAKDDQEHANRINKILIEWNI
jgi:rubrerythrin